MLKAFMLLEDDDIESLDLSSDFGIFVEDFYCCIAYLSCVCVSTEILFGGVNF